MTEPRMTEEQELPPLPEKGYLGDDASYGYDEHDMREYGRQCASPKEPQMHEEQERALKLLGQITRHAMPDSQVALWRDQLTGAINALASLAKPQPVGGALTDRFRALLTEARNTIDGLPGYPMGADLCDRIDAALEGSRMPEEATQPFYDLAWKHGAKAHSSFAGDELEGLTFTPAGFESFCATLSAPVAQPGEAVSEERIDEIVNAAFSHCDSNGIVIEPDVVDDLVRFTLSAAGDAYAEGWQDGSSETVRLLGEPETAAEPCPIKPGTPGNWRCVHVKGHAGQCDWTSNPIGAL